MKEGQEEPVVASQGFGPVFQNEVISLSHVQLFATPWSVAYQAPQSMKFFRQEYWSGFPLPSPEDLPDPGIEPGSPALQADGLPSEPPGKISTHKIHEYLAIALGFYNP